MAGFLKGLFWGAVFGGVAGLMNAPRSGKETRQQWKDYLDQTTDDLKDIRYKVDNLSQAVKRLAGEGMQSLQSAADDIQVTLKQFNDETQPRINRVRRDVENLQTTLEDSVSK